MVKKTVGKTLVKHLHGISIYCIKNYHTITELSRMTNLKFIVGLMVNKKERKFTECLEAAGDLMLP